MVKNVLFVATVSLCMTVTSFIITPSAALAGNKPSHASNPPADAPMQMELTSLEETIPFYGGLLKETHKSLFEELGEGMESVKFQVFYKYDFPSVSAAASFMGRGDDTKPMGVICTHPGLTKYTLEEVKGLLGKPDTQKTDDDGMLELGYIPVEGSPYLQSHVAFKFLEGTLRKIAYVKL